MGSRAKGFDLAWPGLTQGQHDPTLFECAYNISILDYFFFSTFSIFFFYFSHHVAVCHMSWWWHDNVLQCVRLWPPSGRFFLLLVFLLLTHYSSLWTLGLQCRKQVRYNGPNNTSHCLALGMFFFFHLSYHLPILLLKCLPQWSQTQTPGFMMQETRD